MQNQSKTRSLIASLSQLHLRRSTKIWATVAAIACALTLPEALHALGLLTGTGTLLGHALLPMQLPVMLAGFIGGPVVGLITGIFSPVFSTLLTGMPTADRLFFMMAEYACYGALAGLLVKTKLPLLVQIVIVQLSGHVLLLAINFALALFGGAELGIGLLSYQIMNLYNGLPGLIMQWVLIPLCAAGLLNLFSRNNES